MIKKEFLNIAIIGSRSFNDYNLLVSELSKLDILNENLTIVSGGAKGADMLAEKYADENDYNKKIFKPNWKKYGRGAGIVRNKEIIENSDLVIAFWDGTSKGTKSSIDLAKKFNKEIIVITYDRKI